MSVATDDDASTRIPSIRIERLDEVRGCGRIRLLEACLEAFQVGAPWTVREPLHGAGRKAGRVRARDDQSGAPGHLGAKSGALVVFEHTHIRKDQRRSTEGRERARRHDLELPVRLQQQDDRALIGAHELVREIVPCGRGEVHPDRMNWRSWLVERPLVFRDPLEHPPAGRQIVRTRHHMGGRVPEVRPCHDHRHGEVHHRLWRRDVFVPVPGVVEDPRGLAPGKCAKGAHPDLVAKPVERRARGCHVVPAAELVFVGDGIGDSIQLVDVRADHHRRSFDPRIDLGNRHDRGVDGLGVAIDLAHEVGDGLDAEIDPPAEMRVREITHVQIPAGIEAGLPAEGLNGVVVEARPRVLPAIEVRHPIRDVHVDAIDTRRGNLAHPRHVLLAPGSGVRRDPDVLVALSDPERRATGEDGGFAAALALEPVRMILRQRVRVAVGVLRDALGPGDVHERAVASRVRLAGERANVSQLHVGIEEALVASGDVVVHLDAKDMAVRGVAHDVGGRPSAQAVAGDAHAMGPVLSFGRGRRRRFLPDVEGIQRESAPTSSIAAMWCLTSAPCRRTPRS